MGSNIPPSLPTFINCAQNNVDDEILFIVRSDGDWFKRETYSIVTKPLLSDILFGRDDTSSHKIYSHYDIDIIPIKDFILGLIDQNLVYFNILSDVEKYKSNRQYFRQFQGDYEIIDDCVKGKVVYSTIDMILKLKSLDKLNRDVLEYLLEVEYGIKQAELMEFLKFTCTQIS